MGTESVSGNTSVCLIFCFGFPSLSRKHVTTGLTVDAGRQDFLVYLLSILRGNHNEHGDTLPKLDVSALRHVAYVMDALIYYLRNNPDAVSHVSKSSAENVAAAEPATGGEEEGGEDVEDEDSASFSRAEEYDDDTDHVEVCSTRLWEKWPRLLWGVVCVCREGTLRKWSRLLWGDGGCK